MMNRNQTIRFLEKMIEIEMRYDQLEHISRNIAIQQTSIQYRYNDPENYLKICFPKDFYPKRIYVEKFKIEVFFISYLISFIIVGVILIIINLKEFLFGSFSSDLFFSSAIASLFSPLSTRSSIIMEKRRIVHITKNTMR